MRKTKNTIKTTRHKQTSSNLKKNLFGDIEEIIIEVDSTKRLPDNFLDPNKSQTNFTVSTQYINGATYKQNEYAMGVLNIPLNSNSLSRFYLIDISLEYYYIPSILYTENVDSNIIPYMRLHIPEIASGVGSTYKTNYFTPLMYEEAQNTNHLVPARGTKIIVQKIEKLLVKIPKLTFEIRDKNNNSIIIGPDWFEISDINPSTGSQIPFIGAPIGILKQKTLIMSFNPRNYDFIDLFPTYIKTGDYISFYDTICSIKYSNPSGTINYYRLEDNYDDTRNLLIGRSFKINTVDDNKISIIFSDVRYGERTTLSGIFYTDPTIPYSNPYSPANVITLENEDLIYEGIQAIHTGKIIISKNQIQYFLKLRGLIMTTEDMKKIKQQK